MDAMDEARDLTRRLLHSAAFRAGVALEDAPAAFADFLPQGGRPTPLGLLQHLVQIVRMLDARLQGRERPPPGDPGTWEESREEFETGLVKIDGLLEAGREDPAADRTRLAQGPMCDLIHHAGQLALLRRLAGDPPRRVSYLQEARSPVDRVALAHAYLDASNAHDLEAITALLHRDCLYESSAVGSYRGRGAVLAMMREFFSAVPDARWESGDPALDGAGAVEFPFRLSGNSTEGPVDSAGRERLVIGLDGLLRAVRVER